MSRFRDPYEVALHRHEAVLKDAREGLQAAAGHLRTWDEQRPRLEGRLADAFEGLWKERLGLRLRPRFRRRLPAPPWYRIGRALRRLRRKSLKTYRKGLARLGAAATDSGPARYRQAEMARVRFQIWLTPLKALTLLILAALLGLRIFAPEVFERSFFGVLELLGL